MSGALAEITGIDVNILMKRQFPREYRNCNSNVMGFQPTNNKGRGHCVLSSGLVQDQHAITLR
jgi:hypothetical protein